MAMLSFRITRTLDSRCPWHHIFGLENCSCNFNYSEGKPIKPCELQANQFKIRCVHDAWKYYQSQQSSTFRWKQLNKSQHDFLPIRSCLTNLLEFFDDVTNMLDESVPAEVIYLDIYKAFDTIPHPGGSSSDHAGSWHRMAWREMF